MKIKKANLFALVFLLLILISIGLFIKIRNSSETVLNDILQEHYEIHSRLMKPTGIGGASIVDEVENIEKKYLDYNWSNTDFGAVWFSFYLDKSRTLRAKMPMFSIATNYITIPELFKLKDENYWTEFILQKIDDFESEFKEEDKQFEAVINSDALMTIETQVISEFSKSTNPMENSNVQRLLNRYYGLYKDINPTNVDKLGKDDIAIALPFDSYISYSTRLGDYRAFKFATKIINDYLEKSLYNDKIYSSMINSVIDFRTGTNENWQVEQKSIIKKIILSPKTSDMTIVFLKILGPKSPFLEELIKQRQAARIRN